MCYCGSSLSCWPPGDDVSAHDPLVSEGTVVAAREGAGQRRVGAIEPIRFARSSSPPGGVMIGTKRVPSFGLLLLVLTALGTATAAPPATQDGFPHTAHARLFPLCAGCHAAAEGPGPLYPSPALCANCHDGTLLPRVRWTPPEAAVPRFDHPAHARVTRSEGEPIGCTICHASPGTARLAGRVVRAGGCARCHATHRVDSNCALCHAPVPGSHDRSAHAGCDGCHERVRLDAQTHTRTACLVCHQDLTAHAEPRNCVECHPVGARTPGTRPAQVGAMTRAPGGPLTGTHLSRCAPRDRVSG
jgi:hypothetical protein